MYNDPNNPYRKNSQPARQPNQRPNQPDTPPITHEQGNWPNQAFAPFTHEDNHPDQSYTPPITHQPNSWPNQSFAPPVTQQPTNRPNQFRPQQFRQLERHTSYPPTPGPQDFRTKAPEPPARPIPLTPMRQPDKPVLQPTPRTGPWSWYKRQKNIAKLGMGCLLAALILICVAATFIGVSANLHLKSSAQAPTAVPTTSVPKQTSQPAISSGKIVTFSDGTHIVGKDIQSGTYRTRQAAPNCYYARLSGLDGTPDEIIANNSTNAPAIITIDATDKGFQSTNCGTWTTNMSAITTHKTSFGDGIYLVGTDIQAGTYKSSGQSGCYLARIKGFEGTLDTIIDNASVNTSTVVTIAPGDKGFQSSHCGTWTKQ